MSLDSTEDAGWRTWANLVTAIRLALLPVFFWLLLDTDHRALSAWLLGALGATDWVDGYLARRLHQVSKLGKILDPVADRILVIGGVLGVAAVGAVPWWFALLTLLRELIVSILTIVLAALGAARIDVLWWGKVSTFVLMTTFPAFLLASNPNNEPLTTWQEWLRVGCWIGGIAGLTLSWIVLFAYLKPARAALRAGRQHGEIL